MRFPACLVLPLLMTCVTASAGEEVIKDSQGMDCFVYTPDPVDAAKTYQLVFGVHGARGNGKGAAMKSPPAKPAALAKANAEEIPADRLLAFMRKSRRKLRVGVFSRVGSKGVALSPTFAPCSTSFT